MNCRQTQELFDERLDRRLAPERETAVTAHLAACVACQAAWQDHTRLWETLGRHQAAEPSIGFADRTLRRLAEPEPVSAWRGNWFPSWRWAVLGAGLLVAISATAFLGYCQVRDARAAALYASVESVDFPDDFEVVVSLHLLEEAGHP